MQLIAPTFIVGVPRSGTTLLRTILGSHSQITAAPETPWILGGYGPNSLRDLAQCLIEDHTGPVRNLDGVTRETVFAAAGDFLFRILAAYLKDETRQLVLKTPDDCPYLPDLVNIVPEARFVHIHRDGRDVACSTVTVADGLIGASIKGYGPISLETAMHRWYDWELQIRRFLSAMPDERAVSLSYETLIAEPAGTIGRVCAFLELGFEEAMLKFWEKPHALPNWEAGSVDVRETRGIHTGSIGRWRSEIDPSRLGALEGRFGALLEEMGYPLSGAADA